MYSLYTLKMYTLKKSSMHLQQQTGGINMRRGLHLCAFHSTANSRRPDHHSAEGANQRAGRAQPDRGHSTLMQVRPNSSPLRAARAQLRGRPQCTQTLTTARPLPSRVLCTVYVRVYVLARIYKEACL